MVQLYKSSNLLIFSLLLSIILALALNYIYFLIIVPLLALVFRYTKKISIAPILLALILTLVSDINEGLRTVVNILIITILFFTFLKEYGLQFKKYPVLPKNINLMILFVIITTLVALIFSSNIVTSLIYFIKELVFFFLVYLFYSLIKNESDIRYYLYALIFPSIIISVSIIYSFINTPIAIIMLQTLGFTISTAYIKNAAAIGGLFIISINITLYYILIKKNDIHKVILYVLLIVQLVALVLTNSRAGYLGTFISIGFIILSFYKEYKIKIVSSVIILIALVLSFYPSILESVLLLIRSERVFENPRYNLWDISFSIIGDYTAFGVGPGNFGAFMYKYNPTMLNTFEANDIKFIYEYASIGHSHNFFLFLFSEMGLLGLISALLIPIIYFKYAFNLKNTFYQEETDKYWLIVTLIGCGIGIFARSIFESTGIMSYGWITRDLPFWILFIILIFLSKKNKSPNT